MRGRDSNRLPFRSGSDRWDRGPAGSIVTTEFFEPSPGLGGLLWVWTGSDWAVRSVKVWSGTAWVQKPIKWWTGSVWVLS